MAQSTRRATQPPPWAGFRILDASIGDRLSARKAEKATAAAMAAANSTNSRPTYPGRNSSGANTDSSTMVVATTAKNTWRAPRSAATRGGSP